MDNDYIEKINNLEKGQALHGEKIEVANHRIDDLEEELKSNRELTSAVKEIATEVKYMREEQTNMNKRIRAIEEKPSKNWEKVTTTIIGTIVGALVGAFIGLILK